MRDRLLSHRLSLLCLAGLLSTLPTGGICRAADKADASGPEISLFDGQSLNGWNIENDCKVSVQDGHLLLESGNGWLRSDHIYGDFQLHVEWKALKKTDYDAGIYIRTLAGGAPFPRRSYQINLLEGQEGNLSKLKGAESKGLIKPAGQWNSFDITVRGSKVSTVINGKPAWEADGLEIDRGYIGIQVEEPKGGQFLLRNLTIREDGFASLFDGQTLDGWEGAGQPAEKCWKVEGGAITCTGEKGPWIRSAKEYDDFNLRMEYRVAPGGNSGVFLRVPANGNHHRKDESAPPAGLEVQVLDDSAKKYSKLKPYQYCASIYDITGATAHVGNAPDQWNTLELNCNGHHYTIVHNGVMVVDAAPAEFPLLKLRKLDGFLGLQNHSSRVQFRQLRIGPAFDLSDADEILVKPAAGKTAKTR